MKSIIVILFTVLLTSCNAQKINTMKKFDIEAFNKNKNHLNRYIDTLDNGTIAEQRESVNFYEEIVKLKDSYFEKYMRYYKNGNLQLEGEYFNNDFQKSVWKEYDKKGKLIEETDYDKGFDYTWEDLLKLLTKRKVDIKDTDNTTIRKEDDNWRFSYIEGIYIYDVIIDGKTGKVLQDVKNEFKDGS